MCEVIQAQGRPWDIQLLSIQEMLDSIDFIRKSTGIQFQEVYNIMLRRGWTLGSAQLIPLMHLLIRVSHRAQVEVLCRHWSECRPRLVVSLIPHYNRSLKQALDRAWPGTPYVTILTDIADYPPHFWIERQDQYVVCGSDRAAAQARRVGLPASHVLRVSGMILHPRFYTAVNPGRERERERLGLHAGRPTGLVLFGGEGSMEMVKIARALSRARYPRAVDPALRQAPARGRRSCAPCARAFPCSSRGSPATSRATWNWPISSSASPAPAASARRSPKGCR